MAPNVQDLNGLAKVEVNLTTAQLAVLFKQAESSPYGGYFTIEHPWNDVGANHFKLHQGGEDCEITITLHPNGAWTAKGIAHFAGICTVDE